MDGIVGVPEGGTNEERRKIPTAAAQRVVARAGPLPCAPVRGCPLEVGMPGVLAPLRHVAQHVVKPERIRPFQAHGVRGAARVLRDPRNGVHRTVGLLRAARPARVLPLGLAREAVAPIPFEGVQLLDELLGIVPADHLNGGVVASLLEVGRVVAHHGLPLGLGHLRDAHPEARYPNRVDRLLRRADCGAHSEAARRDLREPHPDAVPAEVNALPRRSDSQSNEHQTDGKRRRSPGHRVLPARHDRW
jgi:hypothetical protein